MNKTVNQKAWFLVLPVLLLVAFSAVIPLMTVVNYSVQDAFAGDFYPLDDKLEWFKQMLASERMWNALGRQVTFSVIILAIEIPLGIFVALNMPKKGFWASLCLVLMSLPLLIPWNVVGTIWQIFGRVDIGLLGYTLSALGIDYNYTQDFYAAWEKAADVHFNIRNKDCVIHSEFQWGYLWGAMLKYKRDEDTSKKAWEERATAEGYFDETKIKTKLYSLL
ncbi:hypothetical protein LCGC14_0449870 [marine sediment metagenome]|uniref:ABC transmembrane type-1 domain-containing protein n=1 Tax=marine sediment metagenome TaxID=412755 RepID=A0A0F9SI55_9ZZZZ